MNLPRLLISTLLSTAGLLTAQGTHTLPAVWSNQDAPGLLTLPGLTHGTRVQIIIGQQHLIPLRGRSITGISFRRDADFAGALPAAQGGVVVRLGTAALDPNDVRPDFAANLPSSSEAFRGTVSAPASPANPVGGSWTPPNVVHISFSSSFAYVGGPLCIEIEATNSAATWWPVDAAEEPSVGAVLTEGQACGPFSYLVETASIDPSGLVVGRTATFSLMGQPRAAAWLLLGLNTLAQPIDLGMFGAPGCELRADAFASIASTLSPPVLGMPYGVSNVDLHVPHLTALLGAPVAAQWIEITSGLVTSNALVCTIASSEPSLGIAMVSSQAGGTPAVRAAAAPVVRLHHD